MEDARHLTRVRVPRTQKTGQQIPATGGPVGMDLGA